VTGKSRRFFQALAVTTVLAVLTGSARGATIQVTTTAQAVADDGECSLQEAIYSANFDFGVAPSSFIPLAMFDTGCNTGSGADVIELQAGQVYQMTSILDDPYNPLGPTATPIVLSDITIEANGAQLLGLNTRRRAFAVARRGLADPDGDLPIAGDGIGMLTIQNAHIKGFTVKGGDGASGGGGLGAGGAIYVRGGALTVESCTFEGNGATGGNGSAGHSGGGGGLGGNGGQRGGGSAFFGGGGGGGSRGNGGNGGFDNNCPGSGCEGGGGGGGGTVSSGQDAPGGTASGDGGAACGGDGGSGGNIFFAEGGDLGCAGGGGGGGSSRRHGGPVAGDGGGGGYGGGGGGGGYEGGDGGHGGFGGGGGAGGFSDFGDAGDGDFGGGGGANGSSGDRGQGGTFAGDGSGEAGGGGAGLGGAIFNDLGTVIILNSTFTANFVVPGVAGGTGASSGQDAGGALFSVDGSLTVLNSTISGNESTGEAGEGGGIVFYSSTRDTSGSLTIRNTIIANNGVRECFYTGDLDQLTTDGSGNLIVQNFGCPGMESMDDPMLGPLQINAPGVTPTMAITDTK